MSTAQAACLWIGPSLLQDKGPHLLHARKLVCWHCLTGVCCPKGHGLPAQDLLQAPVGVERLSVEALDLLQQAPSPAGVQDNCS